VIDATSSMTTGAAGEARHYAAFISYCHADAKSAVGLQRFLETYRMPRDVAGVEADRATLQARLRPVFLDRADMAAATDLRDEIDAALAASAALIVVCSPSAAKSRWVDLEIVRFRKQHGDSRIFAVIIDGVAHASEHAASADQECFPPALRLRDTPAGPVRADPAAVDLRRSGDGPQVGRLRLVAGLVGVPLDQLVHRDARRRHRRTLALLIGLSLALAGTSALALYALAARNEAQRQRFAAEGMIEFMIGDLRKTLEPMGRLSAMDPLGKKALDYYRQQDPGSLDADSLARRARVLLLVGEIQDQRGNIDVALRNFETAAVTTAELLARAPNDPKRIFDHAQSVYYVGYSAWRRGNYPVAEPAFESYRRLAEQLVAIAPDNPDYIAEKGYAYSNLATMQYEMGRYQEAEAAFRQALAVSADLARGKPPAAPEQYDLSQAHAWLADGLMRQGKLAPAWAQRVAERSLLENILSADATNGQAQAALAVALRSQARLAIEMGRPSEARELARRAVREAEAIVAIDATNAQAAASAAIANVDLGEALEANGDIAGAKAASLAAQRYANVLTARDRRVPKWQLTEARGMLLRGRLALAQSARTDALALAEAARGIVDALSDGGRNASDARWLGNMARLQEGEALAALGRAEAASAAFRAVVSDRQLAGADEPRIAALKRRAAAALEQATSS
jgi:tetratricopeptide (TPR) repeat protein